MSIHQRPVVPEFLVGARTMTVQDFFAQSDLGLFTPMMWPEFNWSKKQISRFIESINTGVYDFVDDSYAFRFFGSIIIIEGFEGTECVRPIDRYAMPKRVCTIVDGLNRLTLFAVVGCVLYQRFRRLRDTLAAQGHIAMRDRIDVIQEALLKLFSCEVPGARPQSKPMFVHGHSDFWGDGEKCYRSSTSEFFAASLEALWDEKPAPQPGHIDAFSHLVTAVNDWLDAILASAEPKTFPTVWQIRSGLHWLDPILFTESAIAVAAVDSADSALADVSAFVKLFALTQTLFQRCCFTVITPTTADATASIFTLHDELIKYC